MDEIRLLTKDDIEVRVAQTIVGGNKIKVSLLLYKNARVDMKILDELFGPMGWQRHHEFKDGKLYCKVSVWSQELNQWIEKEDVGVESNTEAEKGQASDSFKRACFNWGIGRELYTAPKICIELGDNEYTKDQQNRIKVWASFSVKSIDYDRKTRTITSLEIQDKAGNVRFSLQPPKKTTPAKEPSAAVKARRQAAGRAEAPETPYTPLPENQYWKIIYCYAHGMPTKTGGNYRQTWIDTTHAGAEQIAKFDDDVVTFKIENNIA